MYETFRKKVVKEENEELEHYYTARYNLLDTILYVFIESLMCQFFFFFYLAMFLKHVLCKLRSLLSSSQWPLEALCSLKPLTMVAMYICRA
jgi:hypothetical protein